VDEFEEKALREKIDRARVPLPWGVCIIAASLLATWTYSLMIRALLKYLAS